MAWLALGVGAETALFVLAGFTWFRSRAYSLAEAGAASVVSVFMAVSLIHQVGLLIGSSLPAYAAEMAALGLSSWLVVRRWPQIRVELKAAAGLLRREILAGTILVMACVVMTGLLATGAGEADPAASGCPVPGDGSLVHQAAAAPVPMLNAPGLFYHAARFGLAPGAVGFGLMAYLAVGCCTYALARRYAWPPLALTGTLMVLSMPRLVFLACRPSDELVSALAVLFSLLLIYRLAELHRPLDLRLFLVCILFSISGSVMSIALAAVMTLLMLVIIIRRHGWLLLRELVRSAPWINLSVLLPAMIASQAAAIALNRFYGHPLPGAAVPMGVDGLLGAAVNLIDYVFICADVTEPVQRLVSWSVGLDLGRLLAGVYEHLVEPLAVRAGMHRTFEPTLSGRETLGFGPAALLLVLPSMAYAGLRGPRRLKAIGIAWAGYLYLAALIVGRHADSLAVLTPLVAAGGFVVAFSLPPWRLRRRGMRLLQVFFALQLAWSWTCV